MTNEEKAVRYAIEHPITSGYMNVTVKNTYLDAANEKDAQFKEYLKKKKSDIYWDEPSLSERKLKLDFLEEIIDEFFEDGTVDYLNNDG